MSNFLFFGFEEKNVPGENSVLLLAELFRKLLAKTCSSGNEGDLQPVFTFCPLEVTLFLLSGDH